MNFLEARKANETQHVRIKGEKAIYVPGRMHDRASPLCNPWTNREIDSEWEIFPRTIWVHNSAFIPGEYYMTSIHHVKPKHYIEEYMKFVEELE